MKATLSKTQINKAYIEAITKHRAQVIKLLNDYEYPTAKNTSARNLENKLRIAIKNNAFANAFATIALPFHQGKDVRISNAVGDPITSSDAVISKDVVTTDKLNAQDTIGTDAIVIPQGTQVVSVDTGMGSGQIPVDTSVSNAPTSTAASAIQTTLAAQTPADKLVVSSTVEQLEATAKKQVSGFHKTHPTLFLIIVATISIYIIYRIAKALR